MTYLVNGVECEAVTFEELHKDNKEVGLDTVLLPEYGIALVLLVIPEIKYIEVFHPISTRKDGLYDRNVTHAKLNTELAKAVQELKDEIITKDNKKKTLVAALREFARK